MIQTYLIINVLLGLSFPLFVILPFLTRGLKLRVGHRQWIWVAQALITISIFSPLFFHGVPTEKLQSVEWSAFFPVDEGSSETFSLQASRSSKASKNALARTKSIPAPLQHPPGLIERLTNQWDLNTSNSVIFWSLIFLVLGSIAFFIRLLRNLTRLQTLLNTSLLIRKQGHVRLVVSEEITIPFSVRLARTAWVALPYAMLENSKDYRLAVRHELQHHRQSDTSSPLR